jgi:hypothetical protein
MTTRALVVVCALLILTSPASAEELLRALDWPAVRTGESVRQLPALRNSIAVLGEQPGARIFVRHPGGEAGQAWALEVREWLVALSVPTARIVLEPGSGVSDAITLEVKGER